MRDDVLVGVLHDAASAVREALDRLDDWGLAGSRSGQYRSDLVADEAAGAVLDRAGLGVLSEESGLRRADAAIVVVIDPVDGSTNAGRGLPWYATSLCAVDVEGPRASLVVDQAGGARYQAVRGGGATVDGVALVPSPCRAAAQALVGLSGFPARPLGWSQFRAYGAVALDLCAVAQGRFDGYVDCSRDAHGVWDYLGAALICTEAGAHVVDASGRRLDVLDPDARRTPVGAGTSELLAELVAARAELEQR